jgi:hypothetical protein
MMVLPVRSVAARSVRLPSALTAYRVNSHATVATWIPAMEKRTVRNGSFCVLCRQYCWPAIAPAEPPSNATSSRAPSGTRNAAALTKTSSNAADIPVFERLWAETNFDPHWVIGAA